MLKEADVGCNKLTQHDNMENGQHEPSKWRVFERGELLIMLKNNFGKPVSTPSITDFSYDEHVNTLVLEKFSSLSTHSSN